MLNDSFLFKRLKTEKQRKVIKATVTQQTIVGVKNLVKPAAAVAVAQSEQVSESAETTQRLFEEELRQRSEVSMTTPPDQRAPDLSSEFTPEVLEKSSSHHEDQDSGSSFYQPEAEHQ